MREQPNTLFQILSDTCDGLTTEFSLNDNVIENVEHFYHYGTRRIAFLFYCLEWGSHVSSDADLVPSGNGREQKGRMSIGVNFQNLEHPDVEEIKVLNLKYSAWISNNVLRGLDEFLQYYLLNAYGIGSSIKFSNKRIKMSQIYEGLIKESAFERCGLKERLSILEKELSLEIKYKDEVLSFNSARNVLAHHDGKIRVSDYNNGNYLEVFWWGHKAKAKRRDNGKLVPLHRLNYLDTNKYSEVQFDYFSKRRNLKFHVGEQVEISDRDLRSVCIFYLHVLNTFQESLCDLALKSNYAVRPFSDYKLKEQLSAR